MLDYKVWQNRLQSALGTTVWQGGLQSASGITKCGGLQSELVQT